MAYWRKTLKELKQERIAELQKDIKALDRQQVRNQERYYQLKDRPRIKKQRPPPIRHIALDTLIKGLFEEIQYGNSLTKLYAGLLAKAMINNGGQRIKSTYGARLKELSTEERQ